MSTKFTFDISTETQNPPLGLSLINATQWISVSLLNLMKARGYDYLTSAHLTFFASLDCGTTHASNVARRMGISRQAVYKTTKELQKLGVLELLEAPDDRRQKVIVMTEIGEQIALNSRSCMAEIEDHLANQIGVDELRQLMASLEGDWGPILGTSK